MRDRRAAVSLAKLVVVALLVAYVALYVFFSSPFDPGSKGADFSAYWNAAERLRTGQQLYPPLVDQQANDVFRYSAWFAFVWLPFTYLPRELVETGWIAILMGCGAYLLWLMLRTRTLAAACLAMLLGPWLIENAWVGQVHTLLVVWITLALERRSGPVAIGVAASLKLTPLAFAGWYALRGQWKRAAAAAAIFLVMSSTTLAFDLSHYPTAPSAISLASTSGSLWLITTIVLVVAVAVLAWRLPRYRLLAAGIIAIIAVPRIHHVDATYLLTALKRSPPAEPGSDARPGAAATAKPESEAPSRTRATET